MIQEQVSRPRNGRSLREDGCKKKLLKLNWSSYYTNIDLCGENITLITQLLDIVFYNIVIPRGSKRYTGSMGGQAISTWQPQEQIQPVLVLIITVLM